MAGTRNTVDPSSSDEPQEPTGVKKKFHTRVFPYVAGETKNSHETILRQLRAKGAKIVDRIENSRVVIVFCPMVSRLETDINSALSGLEGSEWSRLEGHKRLPNVVIVVMHHTFDKNHTVPPKREHSFKEQSATVVHCLFHEREGLLNSSLNKTAINKIRKEMMLKKYGCVIL